MNPPWSSFPEPISESPDNKRFPGSLSAGEFLSLSARRPHRVQWEVNVMTNGCCGCRRGCVFWGLVVSAVIGLVAAFLRITGMLAVPTAALAVVFVLAAVYLATVLVVSALLRHQSEGECLCRALRAVLAGILTAALAAVVLLAVPFGAISVIGAIVTGLLAGGVSLILGATACLVQCLAGCGD